MIAADVLKISEEMKYAEKSSPRPLSSATYLANVWESPKLEANWMKSVIRVSTVRVPISSWVIALARKATPKTPITVVRMFRIVKYMDPAATSDASSAFHTFLNTVIDIIFLDDFYLLDFPKVFLYFHLFQEF